MKQKKNNFLLIIMMIVAISFGSSFFLKGSGKELSNVMGKELKVITQTEFLNNLDSGNIVSIKQVASADTSEYSGTFIQKVEEKDVEYRYSTTLSSGLDQRVAEKSSELGIEHKVKHAATGAVLNFIVVIISMIMIVVIFKMFLKGAGKGMMNPGQSKAKMVTESEYRFEDVIGYEEVKNELSEIADFINNPAKYKELNANASNGVLLEGPPGTGKTLMAKALAGETNANFIYLSGSDFVEMYVGVGASRIRDLYKEARKNSPCIIFIDEIDAIGSRDISPGGGNKEHEQTINALLVELDGFAAEKGKGMVFTIGATNRKENLDKALLRPGRFDMHVLMGKPTFSEREEMLKFYANKTHVHPDVDFSEVSRSTSGFSGAHIARIINDSALLAVRDNRKLVSRNDIEEAIDRVHMGPAKKNGSHSQRKLELVSYHEAGHAILGLELENQGKAVQKITIVPRGMAGGYVMYRDKEGDVDELATKTELLASIIIACGGRAAEELFIGEISIGATQDFEQATNIAIQMVKYFGFSDMGIYQTINNSGRIEYSEEYNKKADAEIKKILEECYQKALAILSGRKDDMHLLAKTIQDKKTLYYDEIVYLMENRKLPKEDQDVYFSEEENKEFIDKNKKVTDQINKESNMKIDEAIMKK